nr:GSCFA domain-containing protein [Acuticoccus kalidii]
MYTSAEWRAVDRTEAKTLHPYTSLDPSAYWRTGISDLSPLELSGIYQPKFNIDKSTKIAAAGSCFAQHIGKQFKGRGYAFLDKEQAPPMLSAGDRSRFGFDIYSARFGNIYSMRQMVQLLRRARGEFTPAEPAWRDGDLWFDPLRPAIQPGGFTSAAELAADIEYHLSRVRLLLDEADLFVFTFGLTEAWMLSADGTALPTCPGTVAGVFDDSKYHFHNFTFSEVMADTLAFISICREHNPNMTFLFTVSPVPLMATASGRHVLPSTVYSKSVLRAVCGEVEQNDPAVDYFPSYELIASHPMRAMFFQPNLRSVSPVGVRHVMNIFFDAHGAGDEAEDQSRAAPAPILDDIDLVCEEEALEADAQ